MTTVTTDLEELHEHTRRIRRLILDMCALPEGGHLGGSMSAVEILTALYFGVLRIDPGRPADPARDMFVLSKGHAALGLYATLAERGFFPAADLAGLGEPGGRFLGHPVRAIPGVEVPTGSLGHGLSLGAGFALSSRLAGTGRRAFVVLGDGELQEGSVWEAAASSAALGLDNLVAVVDRNGLQQSGATEDICSMEPVGSRWHGFGWSVREMDGHDLGGLVDALATAPWDPGRPSVIIARTVKGRGVPFAENQPQAHYMRLSARRHARAVAALERSVRTGE